MSYVGKVLLLTGQDKVTDTINRIAPWLYLFEIGLLYVFLLFVTKNKTKLPKYARPHGDTGLNLQFNNKV